GVGGTGGAGRAGGLSGMTEGDLTVGGTPVTTPVAGKPGAELGSLATTFNETLGRLQRAIGDYNTMREQLGQLIGQIAELAGSVAASSEEMTATSQETGRAIQEVAV